MSYGHGDGGGESFEQGGAEPRRSIWEGSVYDPSHPLHPLCGIVARRMEQGEVFRFMMVTGGGMGVDTISIFPVGDVGVVTVDNSLGHPTDIACEVAASLVRPELDREIGHLLDGAV